jgi:hypothetical protein
MRHLVILALGRIVTDLDTIPIKDERGETPGR